MNRIIYASLFVVVLGGCDARTHARLRSLAIYGNAAPGPSATALRLEDRRTVLTCLHTLSDPAFNPELRLGGESFPLRLSASSAVFDLALLRTSRELPELSEKIRWKKQSDVRTGDRVFLFGSPFGLSTSYLEGYVSNPDVANVNPGWPVLRYIQVAGVAYPGTSGAAVYSADGEVIGLEQAAFGMNAGTGIGMVIPADMVEAFLAKHAEGPD